MTDEETARPRPSGRPSLTPREMQNGKIDRDESLPQHKSGSLPEGVEPLPLSPEQGQDWQIVLAANRERRASPAWLEHRAEETSRKQDEGERTFNKPFWWISEVLSWVSYRCRAEMNTSHRYGALYPLTEGAPKVQDADAVPALLSALQRPDHPLRATTSDGADIPRAAWGAVIYINDPKRWPQGVIAREDVLQEWPEPHAGGGVDHLATSEMYQNAAPPISGADTSVSHPTLKDASKQCIIDILRNAPLDPPLTNDGLQKHVAEKLRAVGKCASGRSILALRANYPAARGKGDHAKTLAAHKRGKSNSSKSDAD